MRGWSLVIVLTALLSDFAPAYAQPEPAGAYDDDTEIDHPTPPLLIISHAYARAVPTVGRNSSIYMTLTNNGDSADRLLSASSPLAERVELHAIMADRGLKRMHEVDEIALPAHGQTELKPGTYHIMMIGLKQTLPVGTEIPLELHFAVSGTVKLSVHAFEFHVNK